MAEGLYQLASELDEVSVTLDQLSRKLQRIAWEISPRLKKEWDARETKPRDLMKEDGIPAELWPPKPKPDAPGHTDAEKE